MVVDLSTVPLVALSAESRRTISILLNPLKVIPAENEDLFRDWRGLAHLFEITAEAYPSLVTDPDPSGFILSTNERTKNVITIKQLQVMLERIERWDIIDDTLHLFEKDAEEYLKQQERSQTSPDIADNEEEKRILTVDDVHRYKKGQNQQNYHAFILFADDDYELANVMVTKLEDANLKICVKDRDLIGGITFQHEAVMQLISERCKKLVVIVTKNFFNSPENKFFFDFAQALTIETGRRKIIPCVYERGCSLPRHLNYMYILDYNRKVYDFWDKLIISVEGVCFTKCNVNSSVSKEENVSLSEEENEDSNESDETVESDISNTKDKKKFTKLPKLLQSRKSSNDQQESTSLPKTVSLPTFENIDVDNRKNNNRSKKFAHNLLQLLRRVSITKKEIGLLSKTVSLPSIPKKENPRKIEESIEELV